MSKINKKELIEKKEDLLKRSDELFKNAEIEKRELTEAEAAELAEIRDNVRKIIEMLKLDDDFKKLEEVEIIKDTDDTDKVNPAGESKKEQEKRALEDEKNFAEFIRNEIRNVRENNLTKGDNGALIPQTIAKKIIKQVYDISPLLERSTKYNVKGKLVIPKYTESGEEKINMAYATEFQNLESNIGEFTSIQLDGFLAGALAKISKSLINNSDFDITNEVIRLMSEAISVFVEKELIKGTQDKIEGLNAGVTLAVTSAATNTITAEEVVELTRKVKQRYQKNACFIMHPSTLTVIKTLKDETGRFIFTQDLTNGITGELLGKPVFESDNMDEINAGNTIIYYGDMSGLATKFAQEMEIEVLRERFADQHAVGVIAWTEIDAKVEDAQKIARLNIKVSS